MSPGQHKGQYYGFYSQKYKSQEYCGSGDLGVNGQGHYTHDNTLQDKDLYAGTLTLSS